MRLVRNMVFLLVALAVMSPVAALANQEVNLLSTRQEFLLRPFLDVFEAETGIKVNVVYIKKGMLERLKARPGEADLCGSLAALHVRSD